MKAKDIYNKIEFWIVSIVAASFILSLLVMSKNAENASAYRFEDYHIQYNFFKHFFIPGIFQVVIFYMGYVSFNNLAEERKDRWAKLGSVLGLYLIIATLVSVSKTYFDAWKFGKYDRNTVYLNIFMDGFTTVAIVFMIYVAYYILKELVFRQLIERKRTRTAPKDKSRVVTIAIILSAWIALLIVFGANNSQVGVAAIAVGAPFVAIILYGHIRYLIPLAGKERYKSRAYIWRIVPIVLVLGIVSGGVSAGITGSSNFEPIAMLWMLFAFAVVIPGCWYISKSNDDKEYLQAALGDSQANLSLLRSQINPHFLFNALNTLYGTALQEGAERTGEGVQRLGDMMRFMLHENMQESISLAREVEYLNNYIALQKLRMFSSSNIVIQTNIEEQLNRLNISPMLLIPFVENAFKHGISLQHASFINISLHTQEQVLYFDVSNSVHLKTNNDPEKMKSGIGLQNVKQRLLLLYPKKHELVIRETAKEFFIHLTISLQ